MQSMLLRNVVAALDLFILVCLPFNCFASLSKKSSFVQSYNFGNDNGVTLVTTTFPVSQEFESVNCLECTYVIAITCQILKLKGLLFFIFLLDEKLC